MNPRMIALAAIAACFVAPSFADDEDDLVRLPGQGEVKAERIAEVGAQRLAPGGGLMASFDTDSNGRISNSELESGIQAAFAEADSNADGGLTPLEQQDWASNLPTRDESLFNPVRFDPNLDRTVSADEFSSVIHTMAAGYTEDGSTEVVLASLKREPRRGTEDRAEREDKAERPFSRSSEERRSRF